MDCLPYRQMFDWCDNTGFLWESMFMSDAGKKVFGEGALGEVDGYNLRLPHMDEKGRWRLVIKVLAVRRSMKRRKKKRAGEGSMKRC